MSGRAYLESIKKELEAGRHQHRMGESILAGLGYVRRRRSAVDEINFELERLGLHAEPPIAPEMPLRTPRIRFSLADGRPPEKKVAPEVPLLDPEKTALVQIEAEAEAESQAETDECEQAPPSSFRIGELAAADQDVGWVSQGASVAEAYITMSLEKYSRLMVASTRNPRVQDVKGMISYKSIAKTRVPEIPGPVLGGHGQSC